MDLSMYTLEDLLLAAIKSEMESNTTYTTLAKKVKNALLKDKLEFLANEEEKHKLVIEDIFRNHFPENEIHIPKKSPVPLPEIVADEETPLSKILQSAMEAEKTAQEFYQSLSDGSLSFPKH